MDSKVPSGERREIRHGGGKLSDEQVATAEMIIANPGISPGELQRRMGLSEGKLQSTIMALSFKYYLWEDETPSGYTKGYHIDYRFDRDIPDGDLFYAIFGTTTKDVLLSMRTPDIDVTPSRGGRGRPGIRAMRTVA